METKKKYKEWNKQKEKKKLKENKKQIEKEKRWMKKQNIEMDKCKNTNVRTKQTRIETILKEKRKPIRNKKTRSSKRTCSN